jgi:large subunit ribosomal protein L15
MPLVRRLPKRGFRPLDRVEYAIVNLGQLARFAAGTAVGPDELKQSGLVRGRGPIKCLSDGALDHALTVRAHAFSAKARDRIVAAGGSVEVIGA